MTFQEQMRYVAGRLENRGCAAIILQRVGRVEFHRPRFRPSGVFVQTTAAGWVRESWHVSLSAAARALQRRERLYFS